MGFTWLKCFLRDSITPCHALWCHSLASVHSGPSFHPVCLRVSWVFWHCFVKVISTWVWGGLFMMWAYWSGPFHWNARRVGGLYVVILQPLVLMLSWFSGLKKSS